MSELDDDTRYCPVCGATSEEHRQLQEAANEIRKDWLGLPPLDPPDMETGFQKR